MALHLLLSSFNSNFNSNSNMISLSSSRRHLLEEPVCLMRRIWPKLSVWERTHIFTDLDSMTLCSLALSHREWSDSSLHAKVAFPSFFFFSLFCSWIWSFSFLFIIIIFYYFSFIFFLSWTFKLLGSLWRWFRRARLLDARYWWLVSQAQERPPLQWVKLFSSFSSLFLFA